MEANRTVPYNIDAEKYVLGSVFFDNSIITGLVGRLADTDFYDERNQMLFKAMTSLHANNKKIELLSVVEELEHLNFQVTEEFKHYVIDVIESVPTVSTTNLYIELVEEKALERIGMNYELVGFSEIDKYAVKSYCAVHGVDESMNYGDITKIDETKLPKDIDLITYGFPCQDISLAGKQKGLFNEDGTPTARTGKILNATPMKKFGEVSDLLGALLWLSDDKASGFVTGTVIAVDGGFSAYSGV